MNLLAPNARIDRLEEILTRLPVIEERRESIRMEAEVLYLRASFGRGGDMPTARRAGSTAAQKALLKFGALAVELHNHVNQMPRDALDALEVEREEVLKAVKSRFAHVPPERSSFVKEAIDATLLSKRVLHPFGLQKELQKLVEATNGAIGRLADRPPTAPEPAQRKRQAQAVTEGAAFVYQRLTGRPATRQSKSVRINASTVGQKDVGAFTQFLGEVFDALGIKAKPGGQARLLRKNAALNGGA